MKKKTLEEIFIEHREEIFDYLKVHIKDHTLAQDLTQDIFLKISGTHTSQNHIINPRAYLFILARNLVFDYWRKAAVDERVQKEFWANIETEKINLPISQCRIRSKSHFQGDHPALDRPTKNHFFP